MKWRSIEKNMPPALAGEASRVLHGGQQARLDHLQPRAGCFSAVLRVRVVADAGRFLRFIAGDVISSEKLKSVGRGAALVAWAGGRI